MKASLFSGIAAGIVLAVFATGCFMEDPEIKLPRITITESGGTMENFNAEARLLGSPGDSVTFNIKLDEPGSPAFEEKVDVYAIAPDTYRVLDLDLDKDFGNLQLFLPLSIEGNIHESDGMEITITKNTKGGWLDPDGRIYFVVAFGGRQVVINDATSGYVWDEKRGPVDSAAKRHGNLFILHLTVKHPEFRITQNGNAATNNGEAYDMEPGDSLGFDIQYLSGFTRPVSDLGKLLRIVDPVTGKIVGPEEVGSFPFALGVTGSLMEGIRLTVSRDGTSGNEFKGDKVQLLVWFDTDVVINNRGRGYFWDENHGITQAEAGRTKGNLFIINLRGN